MRSFLIWVMGAIVVVLFTACGDDGGTGPTPTPVNFPMAEGGSWTYTDGTEPATLAITGKARHSSGKNVHVFYWTYGSGERADSGTEYGLQKVDALFWYPDLQSGAYYQVLKYPPKLGGWWLFDPFADIRASYVVKESVTVPKGTFKDCFCAEVKGEGDAFARVWFKPGVGFIQYKDYTGFQLKLVDYSLVNPT